MGFFCATFGDGIAGVRVNSDGLVVITDELLEDELVEASTMVGPEGTCACKISVGATHLASAAPDAGSFELVLRRRLADVWMRDHDRADES